MIESRVTLRLGNTFDALTAIPLFRRMGYPAGASAVETRLARFDGPDSSVIVADHDGEILGFIAVHVVPRFEHDDSFVRIVALVVDAAVRDRGIGRVLMAEAERIGRERSAAFVEITAGHHRPAARHLYDSLGYDANLTAYLRKRL